MKKDWRCILLIHNFDQWGVEDDKYHVRTCSRCGTQQHTEHGYYSARWSFEDNTYHFRTCPACGSQQRTKHRLPDFDPNDNKCTYCDGTGEYEIAGGYSNNAVMEMVTCHHCNGTGRAEIELQCLDCNMWVHPLR